MDAIAERERTKEDVVRISRDLLRQAYGSLEQNREQVAAKIFEGITDDRLLGPCPRCAAEGRENKLRVIRSKASRKRFVGCEGYPDCDQTYPLPQRGDIIALNELCPECGTPRIKVLGGRRPWVLCLDPDCPTKAEYKAARASKQAAAEAAQGTEDSDDNGKGRKGTRRKAGTSKSGGSSKKKAAARGRAKS